MSVQVFMIIKCTWKAQNNYHLKGKGDLLLYAKKKQVKICIHTNIPICTYTDILIFMYMYRNNVYKCIHTRPIIKQSYKIDIIIFDIILFILIIKMKVLLQNSNLKSYSYTCTYVLELGNIMTIICYIYKNITITGT